MRKVINYILKFFTLPICGGVSLCIGIFVFAVLRGQLTNPRIIVGEFFLVFFIVGAILTMIVGWPLLAFIEWKFYHHRWRYVLGGFLCALLSWLLISGAFFPGAQKQARNLFPIVFFLLVGGGAGIFYTFIAVAIDRKFPLYRAQAFIGIHSLFFSSRILAIVMMVLMMMAMATFSDLPA